MEHCIDIEERTVNDGSNCIVKINEDLSGLPDLDLKCCIHRVSKGLCMRKATRKAYEPIVVSIGPYHLKNPKLKAMKKHKLRYLRLLLERRNENVDRYVEELKKLEDRVRKCYVEPIDDLNSEDFVEMMLLDACFIIEFFRKEPPNTILNVDCMEFQICRDLMLLENQLPFFLLSHFYGMVIKNPDDEVREYPKLDLDNNPNNGLLFIRLALSSLSNIIPPPCLKYHLEDSSHDPKYPKLDPREIKHLLHLVHVFCCPKQTESLELRNTKNDKLVDKQVEKKSSELRNTKNDKLDGKQVDNKQQVDGIRNAMHSAVELQEAGVKFKVIGEYYSFKAHLFDITFEDGLMKLPCFSVEDSTDTFFRNLIAFEQHSMDIVPKYFTEYTHFMDQLINSEKDVKLLRDEGIIVNFLGDDKEVSNLFNKLGDGVSLPYPPTSYVDVRKKANRHCNKLLNRMRARLFHDYFNTPWAGISTFGAIAILLLTLLQTIESFENKPLGLSLSLPLPLSLCIYVCFYLSLPLFAQFKEKIHV